jgi:hypothetical protein
MEEGLIFDWGEVDFPDSSVMLPDDPDMGDTNAHVLSLNLKTQTQGRPEHDSLVNTFSGFSLVGRIGSQPLFDDVGGNGNLLTQFRVRFHPRNRQFIQCRLNPENLEH